LREEEDALCFFFLCFYIPFSSLCRLLSLLFYFLKISLFFLFFFSLFFPSFTQFFLSTLSLYNLFSPSKKLFSPFFLVWVSLFILPFICFSLSFPTFFNPLILIFFLFIFQPDPLFLDYKLLQEELEMFMLIPYPFFNYHYAR